MSKSALYTVNSNTQTVDVGATINLGSTIRRFGCETTLSGSTINVDDTGYYNVAVSITATPTAAGTVTATLYNNGVAVPGATASSTVAANDTTNLSFDSIVRVFCGATTGALTVVLSGVASEISNIATVVIKL